jgi:hypothetical protein
LNLFGAAQTVLPGGEFERFSNLCKGRYLRIAEIEFGAASGKISERAFCAPTNCGFCNVCSMAIRRPCRKRIFVNKTAQSAQALGSL